MSNESAMTGGGWVKAKDVLTSFSAIRSFISGDGLPRVQADYWYCAAERKVRGVVQFGPASEGMPGLVHGGAISGVFDEAVGLLSWYLGVPVATRELVVRFRQFVPVNSTVRIEGHLAPLEALMVQGSAVMTSLDGTVHATAQASFVELDPELVTALAARNAERRPRTGDL
jgi:acyl-coenzyme A thioesterase PaaI-like protein